MTSLEPIDPTAISDVRRVLATVLAGTVEGVSDEELLFQRGVIDSMQLVELIEEFSAQLGVEVESDELTPENFESIVAMARYLSVKRRG